MQKVVSFTYSRADFLETRAEDTWASLTRFDLSTDGIYPQVVPSQVSGKMKGRKGNDLVEMDGGSLKQILLGEGAEGNLENENKIVQIGLSFCFWSLPPG